MSARLFFAEPTPPYEAAATTASNNPNEDEDVVSPPRPHSTSPSPYSAVPLFKLLTASHYPRKMYSTGRNN